MPEQRIVITIDENGAIQAKTSGFSGESCIEALEQLLELEGKVTTVKKTDEYHQKDQQVVQVKQEQKGGK